MTSSLSKKVQVDRLPVDRRRPFLLRRLFLGGFPIGSDAVRKVADVPEVTVGGRRPPANVKLDRQIRQILQVHFGVVRQRSAALGPEQSRRIENLPDASRMFTTCAVACLPRRGLGRLVK